MTFNHYPIGWAHAMDSPFQWTKQVASHFGGTRNGMVISWPKQIKNAGKVCSQFHHVIDITPTILEATGLPAPDSIDGITQEPMDGVSLAYTWDDTEADSRRTTQHFEMFANRAIYDNGWIACTTPTTPSWVSVADPVDVFEGYEWELYNIKDDFSESENLAEKHPDKLGELQRLFYIEAVKHDVLPLDNSKVKRLDVKNRPSLTEGRDKFVYYDGGGLGKGGTATLSVDAETVATEKIPRTIPFRMSLDETLNIGEDTGTPVNEDYQVPFDFTGEIEKLTIQISDHKLTEEQLHKYREKQVEAALSR